MIRYQPFSSQFLLFLRMMWTQKKARALHLRRLSLQVATNKRIDAQALGTCQTMTISYLWRISITTLDRGNRRPCSNASKYTTMQPRGGLSTVLVGEGMTTQQLLLKENLTSKLIIFLIPSRKEGSIQWVLGPSFGSDRAGSLERTQSWTSSSTMSRRQHTYSWKDSELVTGTS